MRCKSRHYIISRKVWGEINDWEAVSRTYKKEITRMSYKETVIMYFMGMTYQKAKTKVYNCKCVTVPYALDKHRTQPNGKMET